MLVAETPMPLQQIGCLVQNLGPDTLYLGGSDVDSDHGVPLEMDQVITIGASNSLVYVVSDGESDVRVLGQGLGMFAIN